MPGQFAYAVSLSLEFSLISITTLSLYLYIPTVGPLLLAFVHRALRVRLLEPM